MRVGSEIVHRDDAVRVQSVSGRRVHAVQGKKRRLVQPLAETVGEILTPELSLAVGAKLCVGEIAFLHESGEFFAILRHFVRIARDAPCQIYLPEQCGFLDDFAARIVLICDDERNFGDLDPFEFRHVREICKLSDIILGRSGSAFYHIKIDSVVRRYRYVESAAEILREKHAVVNSHACRQQIVGLFRKLCQRTVIVCTTAHFFSSREKRTGET